MEKNIKKLISKMTLDEKASLSGGGSFWRTKGFPKYGIPEMMLTDGPHGLRKQDETPDHLGMNESIPSTCFPTAAGLACSWNRGLIKEVGTAIGEEAQTEGVQFVLGPGANIKRSPLCGRNFEYYSEDPYLSSQLAANHIQGIQSQGISASLKHFAVNNQETNRFNIDAVVDERTLREIYLASFEGAVIEGRPWTVMAAYNKINGVFCSQNKRLLTDILRKEWGFKGFVVSDWFAVSERDKALEAGLDLEMPISAGVGKSKIIDAIKKGSLSETTLDASIERILRVIFKISDLKRNGISYNKKNHHSLAKKAALESMVLLKNEDKVLPLSKKGKIAIIGPFAKKPRYQGAGSSRINPNQLDIPFDQIKKLAPDAEITYSQGYSLENSDQEVNDGLISEAVEVSQKSDVTVIFAGLPEMYDMEGRDRKDLKLPSLQNTLIDQVCKVQKKTVVVLTNGSAVEMPWINDVKGVFESYLGGEAMADALADLLFGENNPSGKLAETFPKQLNQTPSFINFPGEKDKVEYREGLFVGYRHYDKIGIEPLFPFGYGLSYTDFKYSNIQVDKRKLLDTQELQVSIKVKNIGKRTGKEIVQLYVKENNSSVIRPLKELKAFKKVELEPDEEKSVRFTLGKRAFAYYDVSLHDWHVKSGKFEILVGKSSRDILLNETISVESTVKLKKKYTLDSTIADVMHEPAAQAIVSMIISSTERSNTDSLGIDRESVLGGIKLSSLVAISQGKYTQMKLNNLIKSLNKN